MKKKLIIFALLFIKWTTTLYKRVVFLFLQGVFVIYEKIKEVENYQKEGTYMTDTIIAFILGIVEGITEFLPVSSSGHMILVGHLLGFEGEKAATFEVIIQLGSMLAIAILFRKRFFSLLNPQTLKAEKKRFNLIHMILGVFPAALVGLLLHDVIKTYLFSPVVVVIGLVAGAILMIFAEKTHKNPTALTLDDLTYRQALAVGLFQCLAVSPGFSRSGSTISGGLIAGASHKVSSEFSFLIALPIMVGATGLDFIKSLDFLSVSDIPMFAVGFVTAFVVAMLAVVTFLKILERIGLSAFAYYRIVVAVLFTIFVLL